MYVRRKIEVSKKQNDNSEKSKNPRANLMDLQIFAEDNAKKKNTPFSKEDRIKDEKPSGNPPE